MTKKTTSNKQQNNRILAIVLCVVITVVLLLGGGAAGFFIQKAINPPQKEEKAEDNGGGLLITPDEPEKDGQDESADVGGHATVSFIVKDIAREEYGEYGIMPMAENAQQLTATVTPAEAEDKILDWSVAFKNPSSTWASGKTVTDYVTVSPTADGALTANVSCLQAFGEQVIVTAAIRGNAGVKGTATADYKQGYSSVAANIAYTNTTTGANVTWAFGSTAKVTEEFPGFAKSYTEFNNYYAAAGSNKGTYAVTVTTTLTQVYTVAAAVTDVKIEMAPTADYLSAVTGNKGTASKTAGSYVSVATGTGASATMSGFDFTKAFMLTGDAIDWTSFKRTLKSNTAKKMFDVKLTTTVNGKAQTKSYELLFGSGFGTFADGVTVGPNLVFGG